MAEKTNQTNPFLEDQDTDFIENEIDYEPPETPKAQDHTEITWDAIASKLLRDNLTLSALELHTELLESGRELPRLRDYFSNPGNFERTKEDFSSPTLPRTASVQTFDSLDFARYSDDGERQVDERVAVLEFELRKAQETIKSLRASLTKEAETELASPDLGEEGQATPGTDETIKPLEKRALNFLLNEYLLKVNCKLTSVTFSEENEDQDFEVWDDVGLNIPRPPDLLHLYRDFGNHLIPSADLCDVSCSADLDHVQLMHLRREHDALKETLNNKVNELEEELALIRKSKQELLEQMQHESIRTTIDKKSPNKKRNVDDVISAGEDSLISEESHNKSWCLISDDDNRTDDIDGQNDSSCKDSKNGGRTSRQSNSNFSKADNENIPNEESHALKGEKDSDELDVNTILDPSENRKMSATFRKALLDVCFHITQDNRIVSEVSCLFELPKSLKQILTKSRFDLKEAEAKVTKCGKPRCLTCPDLIEAGSVTFKNGKVFHVKTDMNCKSKNVIYAVICQQCEEFYIGQTSMELRLRMTLHRQQTRENMEKRLYFIHVDFYIFLVFQNEILSSLVLSMLKQMLLDKEDEVREAVVRSLGILFGFICDQDKFSQGSELLRKALKDSSQRVVTATLQIFLPSLASWAYELSHLEHSLIHSIIQDLEELGALTAQRANNSTSLPLNESFVLILLSTLQELIPFLYISVIENGPYSWQVKEVIDTVSELDCSNIPTCSSRLTDLRIIYGDTQRLSALVMLFEEHLNQEWFEPWQSFNWIVNNLIPRLLEVIMGIGLSAPKVITAFSATFLRICRTFGKTFVYKKVKSKFKELLAMPEEQLVTPNMQNALTTAIVPVYAAGVLAAFDSEENRKDLSHFLQETLCYLSLYQSSLDSLKSAISEISSQFGYHDLLLTVLWEGVVHTSAQVRAAAGRLFEFVIRGASESLISTRVVPALVTLGNDPEM
ncbi:hypothetical protein ScPMuIL_001515 [Solemya velum]